MKEFWFGTGIIIFSAILAVVLRMSINTYPDVSLWWFALPTGGVCLGFLLQLDEVFTQRRRLSLLQNDLSCERVRSKTYTEGYEGMLKYVDKLQKAIMFMVNGGVLTVEDFERLGSEEGAEGASEESTSRFEGELAPAPEEDAPWWFPNIEKLEW